MLSLTDEERAFAAFQRTDLLPHQGRLTKLIQRFGPPGFDYNSFVKQAVRENPQSFDAKYWSIVEKEAETLLPYLPGGSKSIMDIGAGLAGIDLVLSRHLNFNTIVLVDKSEQSRKIYYGYKHKGAFYNSLESAKELLVRGGVKSENIQMIVAPSDGDLPCPANSLDVVISTISWGFHYPVRFYIESVNELLAEDGVLIIDVRKRTGGLEELLSYFDVETISKGEKSVRVVARKGKRLTGEVHVRNLR